MRESAFEIARLNCQKTLLEACFPAMEDLRLQTLVTVSDTSGMQISYLKDNGSQRPGKTPP